MLVTVLVAFIGGALWMGELPFQHVIVDDDGPGGMHTKSIGDLNSDGFIDLVVAGTNGSIYWYENPSLARHVITTSGGRWSTDAEVGDIDQDGDSDIVISDWYQNNRIVWWENLGSGESWTMHVIGSPRAHDIEVGDMDGDGDIDIATRTQGPSGNRIELWRQDDPRSWTHRTLSCPAGEGLLLGDIDRDGDMDILIGGRWYENTGDIIGGPWTEYMFAQSWTYSATFPFLADINGDGRDDVVLTPTESKGNRYKTSWFEAPADVKSSVWTEHVIENNIETVTHSLGAADLDGDGDVDVVTAEMHQSSDPDEVRLYINEDGIGRTWTKQVIATSGSHNLRLFDYDKDGDIDIFGANWSGTKVVDLWENQSGPYLPWDLWGYTVDFHDYAILSMCWLASAAQAKYDASADFDRNGHINAADLCLLAANWLKTSPVEVLP